ncbi:OLC1v1024588C1 [Oldenlandia corymbosa var. corymbosa]|uniref:OLC1v1024588C1 n=1 Tax=Oldenlandia corymbosa var. corymbosa TaxID=529605 RepID=A0AAV1C302_OLDCO|nr:OLC1v1024588C1 [Oldenlandia corymbosa var. corymbosa]
MWDARTQKNASLFNGLKFRYKLFRYLSFSYLGNLDKAHVEEIPLKNGTTYLRKQHLPCLQLQGFLGAQEHSLMGVKMVMLSILQFAYNSMNLSQQKFFVEMSQSNQPKIEGPFGSPRVNQSTISEVKKQRKPRQLVLEKVVKEDVGKELAKSTKKTLRALFQDYIRIHAAPTFPSPSTPSPLAGSSSIEFTDIEAEDMEEEDIDISGAEISE